MGAGWTSKNEKNSMGALSFSPDEFWMENNPPLRCRLFSLCLWIDQCFCSFHRFVLRVTLTAGIWHPRQLLTELLSPYLVSKHWKLFSIQTRTTHHKRWPHRIMDLIMDLSIRIKGSAKEKSIYCLSQAQNMWVIQLKLFNYSSCSMFLKSLQNSQSDLKSCRPHN